MEYCEILFDLENSFDILIRAASRQNISSLRIIIPVTMNSTLAVDRADTPVDCIGQHSLLYVQQIIHSLSLDQPVHKRIVNKNSPVPDQQ